MLITKDIIFSNFGLPHVRYFGFELKKTLKIHILASLVFHTPDGREMCNKIIILLFLNIILPLDVSFITIYS